MILVSLACGQTNPMSPTSTGVIPPSTETDMPSGIAAESTTALQRGVNFGNMLEAPNEGDWGLDVREEYMDLIKQAGFDFVRLPVRWNNHADVSSPYALDENFVARVDEIIGWALERDLR